MRAPRQAADFNHLSKVEGRDDSDCRGATPPPIHATVGYGRALWSVMSWEPMDMSGGTEIGEERDPRRRKSRRVARHASP